MIGKTWSPDGRTIAFSREQDGNVDIYTVNVDGSNLKRLTDAPGRDTRPAYTPGGEIIFRSDRSGNWDIWKMSGGGPIKRKSSPTPGLARTGLLAGWMSCDRRAGG